MRRELVRRREEEVRSLLETARNRERLEAERSSPGTQN